MGRVPGSAIHRQMVHVQSISHWAPVSIGPYSQGQAWREFDSDEGVAFVSGQIGLDPGRMSLVDKNAQSTLALRHSRRVLAALGRSPSLPTFAFAFLDPSHSCPSP